MVFSPSNVIPNLIAVASLKDYDGVLIYVDQRRSVLSYSMQLFVSISPNVGINQVQASSSGEYFNNYPFNSLLLSQLPRAGSYLLLTANTSDDSKSVSIPFMYNSQSWSKNTFPSGKSNSALHYFRVSIKSMTIVVSLSMYLIFLILYIYKI